MVPVVLCADAIVLNASRTIARRAEALDVIRGNLLKVARISALAKGSGGQVREVPDYLPKPS